MNTSKKRFSLGWHIGLALGVVAGTGAAVYAVTIPNTFTDGQAASAAAVNANFQALKDAIDGCTTDMVRVGSSCIDTAAQYITAAPGSGCAATGAGCAASTLTVGTAPATPPVPYSWGQALAACTNAGKRLATGAEIIAASNASIIAVSDGTVQYVDASAPRPDPNGDLTYAGTHIFLTGSNFQLGGTNTPYTEVFPKAGTTDPTVAFRCAR